MITQSKSDKAWETVKKARASDRPYTLDYIQFVLNDFQLLAGDRHTAEDLSIVSGLAYLDKYPVLVLGHQKGRTLKENLARNFGMPKPEGYRKAIRLMKLAEQFNLPVISFIDTPGAYPGIDAESGGQSQAIATCIQTLLSLSVPTLSLVIGEGGSGGALALASTDKVFMLSNAIYSVISPEGCASILFRNAQKAADAAHSLQLTAPALKKLNLIDGVIQEPDVFDIKQNLDSFFMDIKKQLVSELECLFALNFTDRKSMRYKKFRSMGAFN
jgi:acetyl-CoA carboxylase carboxyl transferase subunit alpha